MKNKAKPAFKSPLSVASRNGKTEAIRLLNPKREELTPTILKSFPAYEHLSLAEAEDKCTAIQTFARLLLAYLASNEKTTLIDNQQVISLENHHLSKMKKAA